MSPQCPFVARWCSVARVVQRKGTIMSGRNRRTFQLVGVAGVALVLRLSMPVALAVDNGMRVLTPNEIRVQPQLGEATSDRVWLQIVRAAVGANNFSPLHRHVQSDLRHAQSPDGC